MKRRENGLYDAALFAAVLLGYLCARSAFYNFDGVACAIAVELSDFKHLVHGNHLAYGVLAWAFDRSWRLLGYRGDALYALQVLSGLLGAAGAAATARLLRRLGAPAREAALGAAALSVSYAWWMWSLEAQVYLLGAVPLILAVEEALSERPRPAAVGLLHAASMLGHAGHCVAAPALVWLLRTRRGERRDALSYAAWAAAAVLLAYVLAGVLAVRPRTPEELRLWLLGSAALGQSRGFQWHMGTGFLDGLRGWGLTTLRVFCDFTRAAGAARALGLALALLPLAAAALAFRRPGRAAKALGFWLAGHALIYSTWEPFTIVYRVADLPALWGLAWLGLEELEVPSRARLAALALWCAAAGAFNWTAAIGPDCDPARNADLVEAREAARGTPDNAWVAAHGRGQVYLPYFAGRRPLNLRYFGEPAALARRAAELEARGEPLYASARTVRELPEAFSACRLEPVPGGLYRVRAAASRTAGSGKG